MRIQGLRCRAPISLYRPRLRPNNQSRAAAGRFLPRAPDELLRSGPLMGKAKGDFTEILLKRQVLGSDQLAEARQLQAQAGLKLPDAIVKLGYATMEEVMSAVAEFHNLPFMSLTDISIPPAVIELVPESVARENVVLPLEQENG